MTPIRRVAAGLSLRNRLAASSVVRDAWQMARLFKHIVMFAAVNGLLVALWLLIGGGSSETLRKVVQHPNQAVALHFWPVWVILGWATLLVMHAGFVLSNLLFGGK